MKREAKREMFVDRIPGWYNGYVHFALINLSGVLAAALCAWNVQGSSWWEWLFVPSFLVFANFVEWWVHSGWMHHRTPHVAPFYDRHAAEHHVIYTDQDMEFRHPRELFLILAPPLFFPALVFVTLPLPLALGWLVSWNLAWIFWLSATIYYIIYEWFHTVHHWPRAGFIGRTAFARLVRGHHTKHHDPKLMTRGNFNVSFPLADRILRTNFGSAEEAERDEPLPMAAGAEGHAP